jgi:Phage P22-like portal protein
MDVAAKKHQSELERIKKNVKKSYDYFKPNYDRFNEYRRFVFESSLRGDEITLLETISRPQLEFNVLEAYISRLLGEFSKQEPDIEVSADDGNSADPQTIRILEEHLRHTLTDAQNYHTRYEVYKDLLSGGFSALKVSTDYANPMSFNQVINISRVYDPTLVGFDQLARYSHKGDGRFCFELFPRSKEEFEEEYPDVSIGDLSFRRDFAGFNWSYLNDSTQMLLIADYYEKKKRKKVIVQTRDGKVMEKHEYDKMLAEWGELAAPPVIIGKPRSTTVDRIVRYRLIENCVLEHVETDFAHLPLVFVDGSSIMVKTPKNGNVHQITRPYVYHAKGAQRLKNYAGISLANEIENTVQHKFIIKKEALPKEEEWLEAIKDVQKPSNIVVNAFFEQNPDQQIPDPIREIVKMPAPPEIGQAFTGSDALIQNILGSYDASLGINNNQLSGIAIVEAATQSNSAAMPYVVGYLQGYQRAAQIYTDLFPKYYKTPRTIPVLDAEGRKSFVMINQEQGVNMFYDANALNVVVKAGASFQVQKSRTVMMIKELMSMSPIFQQFIGEKGINFLLDNVEGRGVEQLKQMVDQFVQELEQQKQAAMQQQQAEMQNNPIMQRNQIAAAKLQSDQQKHQMDAMLDMEKLKADREKLMVDASIAKSDQMIQALKAQAEVFSKKAELAMSHHDQGHRHLREAIETHHKGREIEHRMRQVEMKSASH